MVHDHDVGVCVYQVPNFSYRVCGWIIWN